jgi:hypothetical protein
MCRLCNIFYWGKVSDHKAIARIFSWLVQTREWECFNEFNWIESEVLSVSSEYFRVIQAA